MSSPDTTVDALRWLEAMALQTGEQPFQDAADELSRSRGALRRLRNLLDELRAGVPVNSDAVRVILEECHV